MGEIADDMIEGFSCTECGIYFKREHGYPVLCADCHEKGSKLPRAIEPELGDNNGTE